VGFPLQSLVPRSERICIRKFATSPPCALRVFPVFEQALRKNSPRSRRLARAKTGKDEEAKKEAKKLKSKNLLDFSGFAVKILYV
jgi:hypothetical protein